MRVPFGSAARLSVRAALMPDDGRPLVAARGDGHHHHAAAGSAWLAHFSAASGAPLLPLPQPAAGRRLATP